MTDEGAARPDDRRHNEHNSTPNGGDMQSNQPVSGDVVAAQSMSAPDVQAFAEQWEALTRNNIYTCPRHFAEAYAREYASSSNAALLDKVQKLRFKLYHYAPFDGQSHTTSCSIWREDGQGHAEGFDGSMGPCNCGALINYWRERAENKSRALKEALEVWDKQLAVIDSLRAERDRLQEALRECGEIAQGMYVWLSDQGTLNAKGIGQMMIRVSSILQSVRRAALGDPERKGE